MSDLLFSDEDIATMICFARDSEISRENLDFFLELLKRFSVVKIDMNFLRVDRSIDDDDSSQVPPLHSRKGSASLFAEHSSSRNYVSGSPPRHILLPLESVGSNRCSARNCRFPSLKDLEEALLGSWPSIGLRMHRCPVVPDRGASATDIIFAEELARYPQISDS
jgi:hypothetical protein